MRGLVAGLTPVSTKIGVNQAAFCREGALLHGEKSSNSTFTHRLTHPPRTPYASMYTLWNRTMDEPKEVLLASSEFESFELNLSLDDQRNDRSFATLFRGKQLGLRLFCNRS